MIRRTLALLVLAVPLAAAGCNAERQIRYGYGVPSRSDAYDATFKAFCDCGFKPEGNKDDMSIVSDWRWAGKGAWSKVLLFPLMWARYEAVITDQGVDLTGNAYGWGIWLGALQNIPVQFPIGAVEDKIRARLRELPPRKAEAGKAPGN